MNETVLLITVLAAAATAVSNVGAAAINFVSKRGGDKVQLELGDQQRITALFLRVDQLDTKVQERDLRIDALETENMRLHEEVAELRALLVKHGIQQPPRPRLRAVPKSDPDRSA